MTAMVQAQSLRGYRELVTDLGGNPTRLLRQASIEPAALNRLTAFITFESLIDLLERSAADLGSADFGLRLAERQDIGKRPNVQIIKVVGIDHTRHWPNDIGIRRLC